MGQPAGRRWHLGAVSDGSPDDPPGRHRVLLVGEDNPQTADMARALWPFPVGVAGDRLAHRILRLKTSTYLQLWRTNLCNPRWSAPLAARRAQVLLAAIGELWDVIVLLGRKVATMFDYRRGFYTYQGPLVSIPHPSGVSREWNDPDAAQVARMMLYQVAPAVPWGEADVT